MSRPVTSDTQDDGLEESRLRRRSRSVLLVSGALVISGLAWSKNASFARDTGIGVAVAGLGLLLYGCVFVFPALFTASRERSLLRLEKDAQDYLTLENSIRGTLLQVVLGIGVLAAAVSAWTQFTGAAEQLQLTRQQFVSGQFTSATDLLSKPDLESRLGGLYTFQRLTENTKDDEMGRQDSLTAYQLLAAFIKAHSPWPPLKGLDRDQQRRRVDRFEPLELGSLRKRSPDVQLALDIVGARNKLLPEPAGKTYAAFLTDADLRGADLGNLHLAGADLRGAVLDYADSRVDRRRSDTSYPDLSGASLQGASLRCAHLEGTNFQHAQMDGADLRGADLRKFPPRSPGTPSTQENADLAGASLAGAIWNEQTQWPDDFDPAWHPELARKLELQKDDQLLAHSPDGTEVLAVVGGSVDTQEGWEQGRAMSKSVIIGGDVVGILRGGTWTQLPQPQPSTTELQPLACSEYRDYWPGSAELCPKRLDRACPNLPAPAIPEPRRRRE
jgi:Pentapeptide repeats (8 copies)